MLKLLWLLSVLSFIVLFAARYIMGGWDLYLWFPLVVFVITTSLAIFLDRSKLKGIFFAKQTKFGLNTLTVIFIVLGFLIGINFLVFKYNKTFDFSKSGDFSLTPQTKQYLKGVNSEVKIEAFYVAQDQGRKENLLQLLKLFQEENSNVTFQFKDPNLFPDQVKENNISESGAVLLRYKGKQARLQDQVQPFEGNPTSSIKEDQIINSIIKLSREELIELCFTEGHKEKSFAQSGALGLIGLKNSLEDLAYSIKILRLLEEREVPESCKVLGILGPELPFEEGELSKVTDYLKKGGKLFLAIDPGMRHNMARLTKLFGVSFSNLFVVDYEGQLSGSNAALTVGRDYNPDHIISKPFNNSMYSFFPVASFFEVEGGLSDLKVTELFFSSQQSFTQMQLGPQPQLVEGKDQLGPFPIAVAAEGKVLSADLEAKAVLVADSDFLVDQFFSKYINKDIALNIIGYLTDEVDLVSIRHESAPELLMLTQTKANVMIVGFLLISAILLFVSIILWIRR